jgi:hypothetical protein
LDEAPSIVQFSLHFGKSSDGMSSLVNYRDPFINSLVSLVMDALVRVVTRVHSTTDSNPWKELYSNSHSLYLGEQGRTDPELRPSAEPFAFVHHAIPDDVKELGRPMHS